MATSPIATADDAAASLEELQRELSELVLRQTAAALASDPTLPLSAALLRAVEARVAVALADAPARVDEGEIAERVLQSLRPELAALSQGQAERTAEWSPSSRPSGLMDAWSAASAAVKSVTIAVLVLLFIAGVGLGAFIGFERGSAATRAARPLTPTATGVAAPVDPAVGPPAVTAPSDQPGG
jgi:hypothetical protein